MATDPRIQRLIDGGTDFTQMTRQKAETLVKQAISKGELGVEQAQAAVQQLVDRGKQVSTEFTERVHTEVAKQLKAIGVATQRDVSRLEAKIDRMTKPPAKKASARKATAKKAPAKKATVTAKKAPAKKAPSKASAT